MWWPLNILVSGFNPDCLNNTYLTLILKVDRPSYFADYRLIDLCNVLYKLITKNIAGRMERALGKVISVEQFFFFFPEHQILDAAGSVEEYIQSIKQKKLSTLVLKLDLEKSYDKVDQFFLHFILF